jgi:hypothetical protein
MSQPKSDQRTLLAFTSASSQSVRFLRPQFKLGVGRISAYRLVAELALIVVYIVQLRYNADLRSQRRRGSVYVSATEDSSNQSAPA